MRRLSLDYQRKTRGGSWIGWVILAVGASVAAFATDSFIGVNDELGDLEFSLARLERKPVSVARGELTAQDSKRYAEEIKFANAVEERLTLPWEDLLVAVESVDTGDVALLALEPDPQKKLLRITAEAKNKSDMLGYVKALSGTKKLQKVHLVDHELQIQVPGQPVRFSLQGSWAAKEDEKH